MGSYSVVQCIRHLMGQPHYYSAANAGVWGQKGYGDGSNPYVWLSTISLLPWLPSFPPQAFPITISSLTSPGSVSPWSTAALALGLLHNPQIPAPSHCTFQGTCIPDPVMYGCSKDYLILVPFRLPQTSCFTPSLKMFLLWFRLLSQCGDQISASVSPPAEGRSSPTNTPVFPPSSFILSSFMWFYILFSAG